MKYTLHLTNIFKKMHTEVYPDIFLNLITIKREHTLVYPVLYPQIINETDINTLAEIIELEDDQHFYNSILDNIKDQNKINIENIINDAKIQEQEIDKFSKNSLWMQNYKALEFLEKERTFLEGLLEAILDPSISKNLKSEGIVLKYGLSKCKSRVDVYIVNEAWLKFRLAKVNQIFSNVTYLLKELTPIFDIKITPFIYFGEYGIAEMFIEFEGLFLLVKIMSNSVGAKLRWREERQEVFIYRKNGRKIWNAANDAIQKNLKQQEILIRNLTNLMGLSTRSRRKPIMKVLLLEGSVIDPSNNPEFLFDDIPSHPYLNIKANSNVFVFEVEGLAIFLAKAAIQKYLKRGVNIEDLKLSEDCSDEELARRLKMLSYGIGKIGKL